MLSKEQNERLTRVGPGTPMGNLLRRYWHPVAISERGDAIRTHWDYAKPMIFEGEAGTVGAMPVVMNAIMDALAPLGVRDVAMPATSQNVWRAIAQANK